MSGLALKIKVVTVAVTIVFAASVFHAPKLVFAQISAAIDATANSASIPADETKIRIHFSENRQVAVAST